ncbi:MAG: AAA family ATPase [Caldithrix sp.]|nr:AAA family ATPase [Caldithrix sp.]
MFKNCVVPADKLQKRAKLKNIDFKTTKDIDPLATVIGQDRAVSSINFALEIGDAGYNLFVTGSYGTGRTTIVRDLLQRMAANRPVPNDWAFVYNFQDADYPKALQLPPGKACQFDQDMQRLISSLKKDLLKTFDSKNFLERRNQIVERIQTQKQNLYNELEKEAGNLNIRIKNTSMGFATVPVKDDQELNAQALNQLPEEEQQTIQKNMNHIQKRIQDAVRRANHLDRELHDELEKVTSEVARYVVDNHTESLLEKYADCPDVLQYLKEATEHIIRHVEELIGSSNEDEQSDQNQQKQSGLPYKLNKYEVNVVRDNARLQGAPVIYEANPTYNNLFGRIEKKAFQGFVYTDYTMIRAGSLLEANGGYLMLDAIQLLKQPFAYEALKRALRSGKLRIEDINELYGFSTSTALRPSSIPLHLKVVLIGSVHTYRLLYNYDEEFRKIFKVRADFDTQAKNTSKTQQQYVQFVARVVKEEELRHFDREGVAAIVEYGHRTADHQKRLSIQFGELVKIIREASFWAEKSRHKLVSRRDVYKAIDQKRYRHNLSEEHIHDAIDEHTIEVDVSGFKTGQINGLVIYNLGDYAFGRPSKITINTYIGSRGIINIEREAKMSGKIHDKGVLVLGGYFSHRFGANMPLSFSASITFEQSYGLVDGDSASSAELYGLLSSLADVPVNQGIAVTGSVNQKGEVQAIGGVNEKIEGFFRVCKTRGLTGDQGVIIPRSNMKHLLLDDAVVQAVKDEKFTIWAVDHIEDGIRILTGKSCGFEHKDGSFTEDSIFERVRLRLVRFARTAHKFRKSLSADTGSKQDTDKSDDNQEE